jgi:hypothetical protein
MVAVGIGVEVAGFWVGVGVGKAQLARRINDRRRMKGFAVLCRFIIDPYLRSTSRLDVM